MNSRSVTLTLTITITITITITLTLTLTHTRTSTYHPHIIPNLLATNPPHPSRRCTSNRPALYMLEHRLISPYAKWSAAPPPKEGDQGARDTKEAAGYVILNLSKWRQTKGAIAWLDAKLDPLLYVGTSLSLSLSFSISLSLFFLHFLSLSSISLDAHRCHPGRCQHGCPRHSPPSLSPPPSPLPRTHITIQAVANTAAQGTHPRLR
jgi:hypothetical protein